MPSSKRSGKILTNEYRIWLGKNPLTLWMRRKKVLQTQVAAKLGVSAYAVYCWQHGTSVPRAVMLQRISKMTGIEDIIKQWETWKNLYALEADIRK